MAKHQVIDPNLGYVAGTTAAVEDAVWDLLAFPKDAALLLMKSAKKISAYRNGLADPASDIASGINTI